MKSTNLTRTFALSALPTFSPPPIVPCSLPIRFTTLSLLSPNPTFISELDVVRDIVNVDLLNSRRSCCSLLFSSLLLSLSPSPSLSLLLLPWCHQAQVLLAIREGDDRRRLICYSLPTAITVMETVTDLFLYRRGKEIHIYIYRLVIYTARYCTPDKFTRNFLKSNNIF